MIIVLTEKITAGLNIAIGLGDIKLSTREIIKYDDVKNTDKRKLLEDEQAKKGYLITNYKGKTYKIIWAEGHLMELKQAKEYDPKYAHWNTTIYPFIPDKMEQKIIEGKNKMLDGIKKTLNDKEVSEIVVATDPDKEGELISCNILDYCSCKDKPIKRAWLKSLTKYEIQREFDNLKDDSEFIDLSIAARCRTIADYLVGINFTVFSSCVYGHGKNKNQVLSIGRVQTPILSAIVERDKQINTYHKKELYHLYGYIKNKDNISLMLKYRLKINKEDEANSIEEEIKNKKMDIENITRIIEKEAPPSLHNLNTLQIEANRKYKMTAKETLDAAQKLYIKTLITYPRTDSKYVTLDMKEDIKEILSNIPERYDEFKDKLIQKKTDWTNTRIYNDNLVKGHIAIIPTKEKRNMEYLNSLSEDEIKVYGLIMRNFLKNFMSDSQNEVITIYGKSESGKEFIIKAKNVITIGFKCADKDTDEEDIEKEDNDLFIELDKLTLKSISIGDEFTVYKTKIQKTETAPPRYYTEGEILSLMGHANKLIKNPALKKTYKNQTIGTPATRAAIIEGLIKRDYIKRVNKNNLVATKLGHEIIEKLKVEDIKTADMTAEWDYKLGQIENKSYDPASFIEEIKDYTRKKCSEIKKDEDMIDDRVIVGKCPMCGAAVIKDMFGNFICENKMKNKCLFRIPKSFCGKVLTEDIASQLLKDGKTTKMRGFISKKNNKTYSARIVLEKIENEIKPRLSFDGEINKKL